MEITKLKLYPSALSENYDIEQTLEEKLNDVNSFKNIDTNIRKVTAEFNDIYHNLEMI